MLATPPSPEELYDATISTAWRLARCLHHDQQRAEAAVLRAYSALAHRWPRDLAEGRVRLLALLTEQAGRRTTCSVSAGARNRRTQGTSGPGLSSLSRPSHRR